MNKQKKGIKIGLIINDVIFRNGISSFIAQHEGMETSFEANKMSELETYLLKSKSHPDVCIADLHLHKEETAYYLDLFKNTAPSIKFVLFSNTKHPYNIKKAMAIGCKGIIDKYADSNTIIKALLSVHFTGSFFEKLPSLGAPENRRNELITDLELKVLKSLCTNKTNKEISDDLNMGLPIINAYKNLLFQKLQVSSREMLIKCAYTLGLIES